MKRTKHRGVSLALVNNTDVSREAEFNRWYDEVLVPKVLASGLYFHNFRYEDPNPKPGQARYMAFYHTDRDPEAAFKALQALTREMGDDWWKGVVAVNLQPFQLMMERYAD